MRVFIGQRFILESDSRLSRRRNWKPSAEIFGPFWASRFGLGGRRFEIMWTRAVSGAALKIGSKSMDMKVRFAAFAAERFERLWWPAAERISVRAVRGPQKTD